MIGRVAVASLALSVSLCLVHHAHGQGYVFTDLGSLEGGGKTAGLAINNHGQIVGVSGTPAHAFLWEDGVMTDLGTLGGQFSAAFDINDVGQIVGHSTLPGDAGRHATLWENGVLTDLGVKPGFDWSEARAINDSGRIVGIWQKSDSFQFDTEAVRWEDGVPHTIFVGVGKTYATGINELGEIVGYHRHFPDPSEGFVWNDVVRWLPSQFGGEGTRALGINDHGQVVGSAVAADRQQKPFIWEAGQITDIGMPAPFNSGAGTAVNEAGEVVGDGRASFGPQIALIHRSGATMDLQELTACGAGIEINNAVDINDAGQIVVSYYPAGAGQYDSRAALLTPADVVPCRKGTVGSAHVPELNPFRGLVDVVFLNGSSGDPVDRRVVVGANEPATLHVEPAPDTNTAHYAIWIYEGESRDCSDVEVLLAAKGRHKLGRADRCLPVANTILPLSCAGPSMDLFGLGELAGVTSRHLGSVNSGLLSLNGSPGFAIAPVDFAVTFPPGTFTVYSIVRDNWSLGSFKASVGNSIVVESMP